MRICLLFAILFLLGLVGIAPATPLLRIVTWDSGRGRTDMILTDTREGTNIKNVYQGLRNPANFGHGGIAKCDPEISYVSAITGGSLVSGGVRQADVFFGNMIDPNDPVVPLSADEATELASFINAGGVVYIAGDHNGQGKTWDPLFTALGISDHFNNDDFTSGSISLPLVTTPITNGPFGTVGYMGWTPFSSIATSTLIPVIKAGGTPPDNTFVAEGAFGAGRLSASGDVIAHDYNTSSTANMRYMLNMFALGCQAPKLQVYQTIVPDVPTPGQTVTITLHMANLGDGAINNVAISDIVSSQLTGLSYTSSGLTLSQQGDAPYTWQAGTLAGQAAGTITITATVAASVTGGATITNLATISGTDGQTPVTDSSSMTVTAQDCYATANDGGNVYRNIQDAVDGATAGATIKVAGYCAGVKTVNNEIQTVYIDKALTILGGFSHAGWGYDPLLYPTTIDPLQKGRSITLGAVNVTLRDLNLINGRTLGYGGAIYAKENSILELHDLMIMNNTSAVGGGGLHAAGTLTANGTQFIGNRALSAGGGASALRAAVITGGLFQDNVSNSEGGGLVSYRTLTLTGTRFINNSSATSGGGLYSYGLEAGQSRVVNALFARNTAGSQGAAICMFSIGITGLVGEIIHTTMTGHTAGTVSAIFAPNGTVSIKNSIIDGYNLGIETYSSALAAISEDNNLFNVTTPFGGSGTVTSGGHSLTGNPKFADSSADDYHLLTGSPAIDHAVDLGVTKDLDGNPRPSGAAPDMGAYETQALLPVRIKGAPAKYFSTLQLAHDKATDGNTIEAQELSFPESLTISKFLTLKGGYDSGYVGRNGFTYMQGLIITGGSLIADMVAVK